MLLIPDIKTVVILVPRTGTTALIAAVKARYPAAIQLYRHMEADGVPFGYDRWRKVGIVRDPVSRLWSLYKYCSIKAKRAEFPAYAEKLSRSVALPFSEWLIANEIVFTDPFSSENGHDYFPKYAVRHPIPENRKSQFIYLRPDLGTKVFRYNAIDQLARELDINLSEQLNVSPAIDAFPLTRAAQLHVERFHAWDFEASILSREFVTK